MVAIVCCVVALVCYLFAKPIPSQLTLAVNEISILVDEKKKLEFECSDCEAEISIEVYDETIVEVDGNYLIGRKVGSTSIRITATINDERAIATTTVSVTENPSGAITNLPNEITLYLLDKEIDKANEDGYFNQLNFESFKEYDVSVSENIIKVSNNTIIAEKEGEAEITFSSKNFNQTERVKVFVKSVPPKLEVEYDEIELNLGEQVKIEYNISPIYFTGDAVVELDGSNKVTIENQTIKAEEVGITSIDIRLNGEIVKTITVKIFGDETFSISSLTGGYVENGKIFATEDVVRFKLISENGISLKSEVTSSNGTIRKEIDYIILENFGNCTLTICFADLGKTISIDVVKV